MSDLGASIAVRKGDARGLRFALAVASFNAAYTRRLASSARARLKALGAADAAIEQVAVPGALELPLASAALAWSRRYDAVLALGCVIRGETAHFDLVTEGAMQGILRAGLDSGVPVLMGVIACDTRAQALARCSGGPRDAGRHAAEAAVQMALLMKKAGRRP